MLMPKWFGGYEGNSMRPRPYYSMGASHVSINALESVVALSGLGGSETTIGNRNEFWIR